MSARSIAARSPCARRSGVREPLRLAAPEDELPRAAPGVLYAIGVSLGEQMKEYELDEDEAREVARGLVDARAGSSPTRRRARRRSRAQVDAFHERRLQELARARGAGGRSVLEAARARARCGEDRERDDPAGDRDGIRSARPTIFDFVTVNYHGTLRDGTVFHTNRGKEPLSRAARHDDALLAGGARRGGARARACTSSARRRSATGGAAGPASCRVARCSSTSSSCSRWSRRRSRRRSMTARLRARRRGARVRAESSRAASRRRRATGASARRGARARAHRSRARGCRPRSPAGKRVGLAERAQQHELGRPRPDPGQREQGVARRVGVRSRREREVAARDRGGERAQRARALAGQADLLERGVGERVRLGKQQRRPVLAIDERVGQRLAEARGEASRELRRARHGHLLAEHDPHRDLERIPGAGHAHAGPARAAARAAAGRRRAVAPISPGSAPRSNTERTRSASASQCVASAPRARTSSARLRRGALTSTTTGCPATRSARRTRPALDPLHAGHRARREIGEQARGVERSAVRQADRRARAGARAAARAARAARGGTCRGSPR